MRSDARHTSGGCKKKEPKKEPKKKPKKTEKNLLKNLRALASGVFQQVDERAYICELASVLYALLSHFQDASYYARLG